MALGSPEEPMNLASQLPGYAAVLTPSAGRQSRLLPIAGRAGSGLSVSSFWLRKEGSVLSPSIGLKQLKY